MKGVIIVALCLAVVAVVVVSGLLPCQTALANIGGTLQVAANSSTVVYENTNTVAAATFDFGVSVSVNGPNGCSYPVTFSWTDAAKVPQSFTLSTGCGSLGLRTTLPAALKGMSPPAITVTTSSANAAVTWTVEEVK